MVMLNKKNGEKNYFYMVVAKLDRTFNLLLTNSEGCFLFLSAFK